MALGLHPKCKDTLKSKLSQGLAELIINHRMFVDLGVENFLRLYPAEQALPERGEIRDKLSTYIGEFPLVKFVIDIISEELSDLDDYRSEEPKIKLTEIPGYEDPDVTAASLVERFDSLPWKYTLTIKFPDNISTFFAGFIDKFELSPQLRIVGPGMSLDENYPLTSDNKARERRIRGTTALLLLPGPVQWDEEATYLQIEAEGFVGRYGGTETVTGAESLLRAFCGLGLALRLFQRTNKYTPQSPPSHFYVHKRIDDFWKIDNRIDLGVSMSHAFNALEIHTSDGNLNTLEKRQDWAARTLNKIAKIIGNQKDSEKILLASEWLFNGYTGSNELLNFLQTMVVVEILLGEKAESEKVGLNELLASRCAYLIAATHSQRLEITNNFKKIYDLRSKIVHRGKHRLNTNERSMFNTLRWMCRRIIQEEVKLLEADFNKAQS